MISGLDLTATTEYILKNDKDNPTKWKFGVIPSYLFARISESEDITSMEKAFKILQISLKGWENFNIPYSTVKEKIFGRELDVVPLSILESIPMNVISELSLKAMELNQITETERKN